VLPYHSSSIKLANDFKQFFIQKIYIIVNSFQCNSNTAEFFSIPDFPIQSMNILAPVTTEKISTYVSKMNKTYCSNDSFDITNFKPEQLRSVASYLCEIVNSSFRSEKFPECEKFAYVRPMIKKDSDPDLLKSYRPLYNTSFFYKNYWNTHAFSNY